MVAAFQRVLTLDQVEQTYGGVADPADAALATKPPAGSSPAQVNAWWDSLTPEQQQAIIAAAPGAIGNFDGIPASARDAANTVSLDRDIADLGYLESQGLLTDAEEDQLENARAARDAVDAVEHRYDPVTGEPIQAQVYIYDPTAFGGDGRIAIAAGGPRQPPTTSRSSPPGFGTDATSIGTQGARATNIYEASRQPLAGRERQSNATLAWIGYDAPNGLGDGAGVATEGAATDGGGKLADTVDGLRASRDGDPAHITAIGHSYGSTTVAHAAHDHHLAVDDIVLTGSPGAGGDAEHASDLGDPDHVWAGANSRDIIANLGNHGAINEGTLFGAGLGDDPAEDDFGAHRFQAESTTRNSTFNNTSDHSKYFDHDTESLHNVASIVNGDYGDVTAAQPVHDPWWRPPVDPEHDRTPTTAETR